MESSHLPTITSKILSQIYDEDPELNPKYLPLHLEHLEGKKCVLPEDHEFNLQTIKVMKVFTEKLEASQTQKRAPKTDKELKEIAHQIKRNASRRHKRTGNPSV